MAAMRRAAERIVARLRLPLNATKTRSLRTLADPLKVIENRYRRNHRAHGGAGYAAMPVS